LLRPREKVPNVQYMARPGTSLVTINQTRRFLLPPCPRRTFLPLLASPFYFWIGLPPSLSCQRHSGSTCHYHMVFPPPSGTVLPLVEVTGFTDPLPRRHQFSPVTGPPNPKNRKTTCRVPPLPRQESPDPQSSNALWRVAQVFLDSHRQSLVFVFLLFCLYLHLISRVSPISWSTRTRICLDPSGQQMPLLDKLHFPITKSLLTRKEIVKDKYKTQVLTPDARP